MSVELRDCVRSDAFVFVGPRMLPEAVPLMSCALSLAGVAPLGGLSMMFGMTPIRLPSTPRAPMGCGTVGICLVYSAGLVFNRSGRASNVGMVRGTGLGGW